MGRNIRAVLFDLDGTLLDTLADLATCVNLALGAHCWPQHAVAEYRHFVGEGMDELARFEVNDDEDVVAAKPEVANLEEVAGPDGRGLLTEEALGRIHDEVRRQLEAHGAKLDGVYYCPFHPEGTVEQFAKDSDLRKPKPGMLLAAAAELDLDLTESWMVGDSPRDIEAGQRAGCRTIRIHSRPTHQPGEGADEDVQADYTVRNLVDAARIILREGGQGGTGLKPVSTPAAAKPPAEAEEPDDIDAMDDRGIARETLRAIRRLASPPAEEFSPTKMIAGILQVLALMALAVVISKSADESQYPLATIWGLIALTLQVMALTFFSMRKP